MKKRYFAGIVTSLLLTSSILGACSSDEGTTGKSENVDNVNKMGMPIVKEKIKVDGFGAKFFASQDWNKLMLWDEYEKMTNVDVNWKTTQIEGLVEKRNLMLASGDYPEVFYASAFPKTDLIKYGKQGVFLPLNDYIDEYAPNFKKLLEENPSVKKGVTMADGNIYGFPAFFDPKFDAFHAGTPWIKEDWLKKLGLKEPETTDELYTVLKAFKEKDPNGNGKADEIPWGTGYGINMFINYLRGSFDLNKQGVMNSNLDFKEGTEEFRFVPATDEYKELLKYLNKLYTEGLINQDVFTVEPQQFHAEASKGNVGMIDDVDPKELFKLDGYVGVPVLEGPTGERSYNAVTNGLGNMGMFVITDKAKSPEAMVRWMDYFYSDEGSKMFFMGFEGVTYEEDKEGNFKYLDTITDNPDGKNLDQAVSDYLTWPGGYYPGIVKQKYFQGAEGTEASAQNAKKVKPYVAKDEDIIPGLNYTLEENDEVSAIMTDVQTYINEMTAGFITGKQDFSKWDDYNKTLDKMKVQDYLKIAQAAYDRTKSEK
ncbi:extracellular solute-binding protein [Viridibacillus arvi]|uniref:ABC transporter substrate-binding protein n=1 Tax=Viridibacillus arvi TaxID=263475 RepID=A0A0M0LCH1_9BACL|nr:extracellular solute-binding protein [Viridibacillus arvi]KOO48765.1 ABC transporter substrate-binding protein [Viridibacillus arvi]